MRLKKILSGMLAGAMVLTSVITGELKVQAVAPTPDYMYSFEDTLDNASLVTTRLSPTEPDLGTYSGDPVYEEGKTGKAIRLGDYGLKLNRANIGETYTVSMWLKPDGTIEGNTPVLFLGYHAPEKWVAVAGNSWPATQTCKFWTLGTDSEGTTYSHGSNIINGSIVIPQEWTMLTITGDGNDVNMYINGALKASGKGVEALDGENQDIYLGVSYWDSEFVGLMDEVSVYTSALSAAEVFQLYDPTSSEEDIFIAQGFTASAALSVTEGYAKKIAVTLPAGIAAESATTTFESADDAIATVDENGNVTGVAAGRTVNVTTSVTVGSTTKMATTVIKVRAAADVTAPDYTYGFEDSIGGATAISRLTTGDDGYEDYTGSVVYEEGKSGKAVKLNGYGLKLNNTDIGDVYTVSMWVKPTGTIANNTPVLFLGYHYPQKWVAVSGNADAQTCKFWTNGADAVGNSYGWANIGTGTVVLPSTDWKLLTITSDGNDVKAYVNGTLISSGKGVEALDGENQDIFLGITHWDPAFSGLIDEVKIYKADLTPLQVYQLYDPSVTTAEEVLDREGISVSETLSTRIGSTAKVNVTIPAAVSLESATITYTSSEPAFASVDADGVVTGVATGSTVITTEVTLGSVTKSATTIVTVKAEFTGDLIASFDFDDPVTGLASEGALATVQGTASYVDSYSSANGKAASMSKDFWLDVKADDGTPLLQGLDTITISYDGKAINEGGNTGWVFYAAPHLNDQSEPPTYLGIWDRVDSFTIERFYNYRFPATTGVASDEWKHVDVVVTETETSLYINGVLQQTVESTAKLSDILTASGGYLQIGKANWPNGGRYEFYTGLLDNFKIYNVAKTAEEIAAGVETVTAVYTAGPGGKITGTATQTVLRGANSTTVTATPNTGYKFVKWKDNNSTVASRTDTNLTSNLSAEAEFEELPRVRISYKATEGGYISGTAEQDVYVGSSASAVTAVAEDGYYFDEWDDGTTTPKRTDKQVSEAKTYTAKFVKDSNPVTVTYLAGAGGKISGTAVQTIEAGTDTQSVTAVPDSGYKFSKWSDGVTTATRKDTNVAASKYVTAQFVKATIDPTGVKLNKNKLTIGVKETYTVVPTVSPATATNKTVTYKSSNTKVATVNKNGQIKGVTKGTAKITASTVNGKTFTCTVTVKKAPNKINILVKKKVKKNIALKKGASLQLKTKLPKGTASYNLKWTSNKAKVVSVSKAGKVKALKSGKSTITVKTFNGRKATIKITVK